MASAAEIIKRVIRESILSELSGETLGSYVSKAEKEMVKIKAKDPMNTTFSDTDTMLKRKAGVDLAKSKMNEATHGGRKVTLNKPFRTPGGPKKSAVYVDPDGDGKAKIVRFGDPKLSIKKDQPARKRSYCARSSGQDNLSDKGSANYWSRRAWNCEETEIDEAGGFSYGRKAPRKGSVAYNAMMQRKKQERDTPPIEPKDQMVGVAKVSNKNKSEINELYGKSKLRQIAKAHGQKLKASGKFAHESPHSAAISRAANLENMARSQKISREFGHKKDINYPSYKDIAKVDRAEQKRREAAIKEQQVNELSVPAGTTGRRTTVSTPMVAVRMASGKIERHPPGKSGSSGGGGNGAE